MQTLCGAEKEFLQCRLRALSENLSAHRDPRLTQEHPPGPLAEAMLPLMDRQSGAAVRNTHGRDPGPPCPGPLVLALYSQGPTLQGPPAASALGPSPCHPAWPET